MGVTGSVLVVGGGISGVQAALDLGDSGFFVHLVEKSASIGGKMAQLDKTFPTNDCSACILSPKLVEAGRHLNIRLHTLSEVLALEGKPGDFTVTIRKYPRYIDMTKCIACGACAEKCPKKVDHEFDYGLSKRKAAHIPYPQAVPLKYLIDAKNCIYLNHPGRCGICKKVCPTNAVNFEDKEEILTLKVGAVILSTGYKPFNPEHLYYTGYKTLPNVVTSLEFERILSPSGPCMGHLVRPSDHKVPRRIAWLQCVGSRSTSLDSKPYCSSFCCMYAIKQAIIAREHTKEPLETHIYYMDMRTHGKDFEEYYNRAVETGVRFIKARVHNIMPRPDGSLLIRYTHPRLGTCVDEYDLVVLSVAVEPDDTCIELSKRLNLSLDEHNFIKTHPFEPSCTSREGIFVCGNAQTPKDIPQSVMDASSAVSYVSRLLKEKRWTETYKKELPPERNIMTEAPRIGVFVCHCGINIGSVVNVKEVAEYAKTLKNVEFVQDFTFTCSQDTIDQIVSKIREHNLNRIVVAACSPRTHEPLFQETLQTAGLNKNLFEMANIRDQDSWVHRDTPEEATRKAKDLVRMAVHRVRSYRPLKQNVIPITKAALVIGGGVAGMVSALNIAEQGYRVYLVERKDRLGGHANKLLKTWQGEVVDDYVQELSNRVMSHPLIEVKLSDEVVDVKGSVGRFISTLKSGETIEHGVAVIAAGGKSYKPPEDSRHNYLYGNVQDVILQTELEEAIKEERIPFNALKNVVFIQCVGSRIPERPYCSRVCCTQSVKQALLLKEKNPDMNIYILYRDMRTFGMREDLYVRAKKCGVMFLRHDLNTLPEVRYEGKLIVKAYDEAINRYVLIEPDKVVLATGIVPREDVKSLAMLFKCAVNKDGYLLEAHMKLRPVDFATDGVFLAGLCHYPKFIDESISQAMAASTRAVRILSQDFIEGESVVAYIDPSRCTSCGLCISICPYRAISWDERSGRALVNESLCKACGACVAGCRSDAPTLKNIGNQELINSIKAGLQEEAVFI